jgi:hypothetical protein
MRQLALAGCVVVAAIALPVSTIAKPVRVVVYRFSIDQHGFSSSQSSGYTDGHGFSRYATTVGTIGASGTITVNVLATPRDGGLLVDAIEQVDRADRAQQPIRCAVYGNPEEVVCDQNLTQTGEVTGEVTALLMYLGRGFYDRSRLDDRNHWQTTQQLNQGMGNATADYTVKQTIGDIVTISVNRVLREGSARSITTGTIDYNPSATLPVKAHLVTDGDGGGLHGSIIDFQLVSDSFQH